METVQVKSRLARELLAKMPLTTHILPFYSYAHRGAQLMLGFRKESSLLLLKNTPLWRKALEKVKIRIARDIHEYEFPINLIWLKFIRIEDFVTGDMGRESLLNPLWSWGYHYGCRINEYTLESQTNKPFLEAMSQLDL